MWTQIVGKVRLALTPLVNHWWNVPLYVTSRGLTTSIMPYGDRSFELRFDFLKHQLVLETSDGALKTLPLAPKSVADFYQEFVRLLRAEDINVKIWRMPVEIKDPIPFDEDRVHASYDAESVEKFWRILVSVDAIFKEFRAGFIGKSSPVHFFWGSFDLAVTRFSGRRAPERPGADAITKEAYSHEVSSVGFWPGPPEYRTQRFIPMRHRSRTDSSWLRRNRKPPGTTLPWENFCCSMRRFESQSRPANRYCSSARVPMRRQLTSASGTALRLSAKRHNFFRRLRVLVGGWSS